MASQSAVRERDGRQSEVERLRHALDEQTHLLQEIVDSVPEPLFFEDCSGNLRGCNRAFLDLFGLTPTELAGASLAGLTTGDRDRGEDLALLRSPGARSYELIVTAGGRRREMTVSKSTYLDAGGRVGGVIGVMTDLTDSRRVAAQAERLKSQLGDARQKLAALSLSDELTGLANQRQLDETLDHEWRRASRSGAPIAFLMIDIDEFSVFNDTYGRIAGDECLVAVAEALRVCLRRPGDVLVRYSGEQFLAVLPGTGEEGAQAVAESMREAVRALDIPDRESPRRMITVSVGVAVALRERYSEPGSALAAADAAVCRAKSQGCDRVVVSRD